jgi:hypothetical protein
MFGMLLCDICHGFGRELLNFDHFGRSCFGPCYSFFAFILVCLPVLILQNSFYLIQQ